MPGCRYPSAKYVTGRSRRTASCARNRTTAMAGAACPIRATITSVTSIRLAPRCSAAATASPCSHTTPVPRANRRPVAQLVGHRSPVLAAQWNSTGRSLLSLASDGSIVSWDVDQSIISEQSQVPLDSRLLLPDGEKKPVLRFHAFTEGIDGRLMVAYAAANEDVAKRSCPGAHHPGTAVVYLRRRKMAVRGSGRRRRADTRRRVAPLAHFSGTPGWA